MTFYMKPPRGNIALHTLRECVMQRFDFLSSLETGEMRIPRNFEYLYDGTPMDRAGHFLLRLLSLRSDNFKQFVYKTETELFVYRFNLLDYSQFINMLKVVYKHAQEGLPSSPSEMYSEFLHTIKNVCKNLMQLEIAAHLFRENHQDSCSDYCIEVPFRMCLPFVRNREVELRLGKCIVPCGKWKCLLRIMFELHLEFGMKHLKSTGCFDESLYDPRIYSLGKELERKIILADIGFMKCITGEQRGFMKCITGEQRKKKLGDSKSHLERDSEIMTANDVSGRSAYFPPCMIHLYRTLQVRHRLSHEARRQFTLFLKDAGMPVEEALIFWRQEYSQSNGCKSGCTHSWQKDAHRYRYSIRHMYGLEGGRYSYRVASCHSIQRTQLTASADGGCPFQHFDTVKTVDLLSLKHPEEEKTMKAILNLKENEKPYEACLLHLTAQLSKVSNGVSHKTISFTNPLQYYMFLKTVSKCN